MAAASLEKQALNQSTAAKANNKNTVAFCARPPPTGRRPGHAGRFKTQTLEYY
jgi:hypothetical protein